MPLTIHVASETRLRRETHTHRCPICKKTADEINDVCGKCLAGTSLTFHRYPCLRCSNDWRVRFGQDAVTAYLEEFEAAMLTKVWPNAKVEKREQAEAARGDEDAKAVTEIARKI